jgi:hypothetical protein
MVNLNLDEKIILKRVCKEYLLRMRIELVWLNDGQVFITVTNTSLIITARELIGWLSDPRHIKKNSVLSS